MSSNPYLDGPRQSPRQKYTDKFYVEFARLANDLYSSGSYSLPDLAKWAHTALGATVSSDEVRSIVSLCRQRNMLDKPGYGSRVKVKKAVKKAAPKPKAVKIAPPAIPSFDPGLSTDDMMDFVVQLIYCDDSTIPVRHITPLIRFRSSVDDLLKSLV